MAQVVKLLDDLDGSEDGVITVSFAHLGKPYEIDLSAKNADKLAKALAPFIEKARTPGSMLAASKGTKTTKTTKPAKGAERDYDPAQVREWQQATGRPVSTARFPDADLAAYREAQRPTV